MKILHTADVHLHTRHPRRLEALTKVVNLGREENIDLLLIAGDLFDDHHQAELLRGEVRRLFSNLPYKVLAIPGNHDERAFSEESYYGSDFIPLTQRPYALWETPQWRIVALPYGDGSFAPLVPILKDAVDPNRKNILLLHCTWSLPHYSSEDYGGDDQLRYLPVTEAALTGLGYDYILAGHFHTNYRQRKLPCGSLFVYPGSPVSVSAREQGHRSVNFVDANGCRQMLLDSWYYQSLDYHLNLNNTEDVLQGLARDISQHPDQYCDLTVTVGGYIQEAEQDFQQSLNSVLGNRVNTKLNPNYRSAVHIYSDSLYQRFQQRLEQETDPKQQELMKTMILDAFSQLLAEGR